MKRLFMLLFVLLTAGEALAQEAEPEDESLDLFDANAEVTETGWSQFTVSLGYMWLDADGEFLIRGGTATRPASSTWTGWASTTSTARSGAP